MRLLSRGPLLALLTSAALAVWRAFPAPGARSIPRPAGGLRAAPGHLLLEPLELDLGCLEPGERREAVLSWRLEGAGPLTLLAVDTGCGCLGLTGLPARFEEGRSGTARLALAVAHEPGPLETYARVVLGRPPPDDVLRVRVRGYVGRGVVVRPAWLDLGRRSAASRAAARFAVHLPPGAGPDAVRVELAGWPGSLRANPPLLADQSGPDLTLDSTFPARPGPLVGALVVRTRTAGEAVVPLRAEVVAVPEAPTGPARAVSEGGARPGPCPPW